MEETVSQMEVLTDVESQKEIGTKFKMRIDENINKGDFSKDPYTTILEIQNAKEEHLIFIVHGMGQNSSKLESTIRKTKSTLRHLYSNKPDTMTKQIHVRIIDWKTHIEEKEKSLLGKLVDSNNHTKYSKMFIQQTPLDCLHYLSSRHKYEMLNNVVYQMNTYLELVQKHRPLFKGKVSVAGHSLGSVMLYDILSNMTYKSEITQSNNYFAFAETNCKINPEKLNRKIRKEHSIKLKFPQKISFNIVKKEENDNSCQIKMQKDISNKFKYKIYSKHPSIDAIKFYVDHFFLLGSPLSLFITVEQGDSFLQEMEVVKDFHNIIHPMDPVAYRIEHLIKDYPSPEHSFTLPHWENDGIRNVFLHKLMRFFFPSPTDDSNSHLNHNNIDRKRYDFMVQESSSEKAVNIIGFLFSHQAYWTNPDVFYFMLKMIHWQGYNHVCK